MRRQLYYKSLIFLVILGILLPVSTIKFEESALANSSQLPRGASENHAAVHQELSNSNWIAIIGEDKNIWCISPTSQRRQQITSDASNSVRYSMVKWSPTGTHLAFVRSRDEAIEVVSSLVVVYISNFTQLVLVEDMMGG